MSSNALVVQGSALLPAMTVQEAGERYNIMVEYTKSVMKKDQDFGTIPGVAKPCLYKAGAEKLLTLFALVPSFSLIERTEDWVGKDHGGAPFFYYFYKCQLMRGGEIIGEADGSCNSWEKKYRYRKGARKCPKCGRESIIVGKEEYGGGFLCYGKKSGCGAKFQSKDPAIIGQDIGDIPNPDIAEVVNTIQKMAQKRALIAAVLIACNASAFYTQDVEDMHVIDVDYEPIETLEEVRDRKVAAAQAAKRPTPAQVEQIIEEETQAPAAEEAAPAKPPRKRGDIGCKALGLIKEQKKLLNGFSGSDALYYEALAAFGVEHADSLTQDDGRKLWKALNAMVLRFTNEQKSKDIDTERRDALTQQWERVGQSSFVQVLGNNGFASLEEMLQSATVEQEATILRELRAL